VDAPVGNASCEFGEQASVRLSERDRVEIASIVERQERWVANGWAAFFLTWIKSPADLRNMFYSQWNGRCVGALGGDVMVEVFAPLVRAASLIFLILSFANPASAKPSDCLFEVDGQRIIDRPCQFVVGWGGSFRIFTLRGSGLEYVAEVNRVGPEQGIPPA
jgi:hypothetical protein